jgi:hypothetical protein
MTSFHVAPPAQGASVELWQAWMIADKKAAIQAKREETRKLDAGTMPVLTTMVKKGGVYKQVALLGYVGDSENLSADVAVEATQEKSAHMAQVIDMTAARGTMSKGRNARRRANKRAQRAARFR